MILMNDGRRMKFLYYNSKTMAPDNNTLNDIIRFSERRTGDSKKLKR